MTNSGLGTEILVPSPLRYTNNLTGTKDRADQVHNQRSQLQHASTRLRFEVFLVFALFLSVFALTSAGFDTSEGRYDYAIAHQIVANHSLSFAQTRDGIFTVAPNGRTYASHEIGNALGLLPVAAINILLENVLADKYDSRTIVYITGFTMSMMPVIYCAVTIALFYAMLRRSFDKSIRPALNCSLATGFCTFIWTYSRNLFDGVLCMCILSGIMLCITHFRRTTKIQSFLLAVVLCGFGIITRLTMVLVLPALAVYLTIAFWKDFRRVMMLAVIGAGLLTPFALWQTYYNHLRTGNWLTSPVQTEQYAANNGLTGNPVIGTFGLLLSPGKSIFIYVPLLLVSVVCFRRFSVNYPSEAGFVIVLSLMWLLLHSRLASWYGASGWGPRHFITIVPVLVLPACACWDWVRRNVWRRALLICALIWGAIVSSSSIIGNWSMRMGIAVSQGRQEGMVWSLRGGQAADMISSAISNLRNLALRSPAPCLPSASSIDCYASNSINVWINTASYAGVPRILLAMAALLLISVSVYCMIALRQCAANETNGL